MALTDSDPFFMPLQAWIQKNMLSIRKVRKLMRHLKNFKKEYCSGVDIKRGENNTRYVGKKVPRIEVRGNRGRGWPKKMWKYCVIKDI